MVDVSALPKAVELDFAVYEPSSGAEAGKTPVIIGHGLFSCKDHWTDTPQKLADRTNRKVWIFDVRDHGSSPHTTEFGFKGNCQQPNSPVLT